MTTSPIETIPTSWSEERDGTFFRLVAKLFPPAFTTGASVLLASYDDDTVASPASAHEPVPQRVAYLHTAPTPQR